jgi:NDP-sugar pyrophosphorylase family protein
MTQLNPVQLLRFHYDHQADATLCARNYSVEIPFGVVKIEADDVELSSFEEKPTYNQLVNTGIYIIDPMLLSLIAANKFTDMPSLLQSCKQSGHKVVVCPMHEYWLDVGNPNSLETARLQHQS